MKVMIPAVGILGTQTYGSPGDHRCLQVANRFGFHDGLAERAGKWERERDAANMTQEEIVDAHVAHSVPAVDQAMA